MLSTLKGSSVAHILLRSHIFIDLLFGTLQPKRTIFDRMEQGYRAAATWILPMELQSRNHRRIDSLHRIRA